MDAVALGGPGLPTKSVGFGAQAVELEFMLRWDLTIGVPVFVSSGKVPLP